MKDIKITEQLSPNIKTALFSNFTNAYEAIQEIIDNSVGHRIPGRKMWVSISFIVSRPKKIEIKDVGGTGMSIEDLKFFFDWGGEKTRGIHDIGLYSQGGKSAIGYLGNSFVLITSPNESDEAYRVEDHNLRDTSQLKTYRVLRLSSNSKEGFTSIEIGDLKINITENTKDKIKKIIVDTYRPLIEKGEVELIIDGVRVKATSFPLDKEFQIEKLDIDTAKNKHIKGWVGRLMPRSGLKGGIRCYYKGRLICAEEFFGHPDPTYKATLNFLFGEIFLDSIPVNTNKTDFQRDSREWKAIEDQMHSILNPHIDELLGRTVEEPTEEEINRVKNARDLFQAILKLINQKSESDTPSREGEDHGQKPLESRKDDFEKRKDENRLGRKNQPRTPPPPDKIGIRKRLRRFMDWDIRPMEETIRSKIEETKDGKILIINNVYPGFTQSKGNNFYLLETAALQTVPIEDSTLTPKKYLEEFDLFFGKICENMNEAKEMLNRKKRSD